MYRNRSCIRLLKLFYFFCGCYNICLMQYQSRFLEQILKIDHVGLERILEVGWLLEHVYQNLAQVKRKSTTCSKKPSNKLTFQLLRSRLHGAENDPFFSSNFGRVWSKSHKIGAEKGPVLSSCQRGLKGRFKLIWTALKTWVLPMELGGSWCYRGLCWSLLEPVRPADSM